MNYPYFIRSHLYPRHDPGSVLGTHEEDQAHNDALYARWAKEDALLKARADAVRRGVRKELAEINAELARYGIKA